MKKNTRTTNAVEIIHHRYIGDDADRKASLEAERVNAEVAQMIYELRQEAGLSQKELGDLIGTTQSVISRLEDADYEGHSLSMLSRIAKALNKHLNVEIAPKDPDIETMRYVFSRVIQGLRRERGLKVNEFAEKSGIDRNEVIAMERNIGYRPTPLTLYKLSKFFGISQRKLSILTGAIVDIPHPFREEASKFAAKAESFSNLTPEEKRTLDEFVKFLKTEDRDG
jgi:transcriptional regulator with XRE-family HTH domain